MSGQVAGQDNYVLLPDLTGIERMDYEIEMDPIIELQKDVNELAGSVFLDFKFYDVGLYLHSSVYEEEIDEYMNRIISDEVPTGAQYLIFARISDKNGIYSRLKFYSNLPENPAYCFNNDNFQVSIQDYIDYYSIGSVSDMLDLQRRVIPVIINQLKIQYVCCVPIGEIQNNKKSKSLLVECSEEEDLLANHYADIDEKFILNFLSCKVNDLGSGLDVVEPNPIWKSINKLPISAGQGCGGTNKNILHWQKVDLANPLLIPTGYTTKFWFLLCSGNSDAVNARVYDFGTFKITTAPEFDLLNYISNTIYNENKILFEAAITAIENDGNVSWELIRNLSAGIGCIINEPEFTFERKYNLFWALLNYDDQQLFYEQWVELFINFAGNDYSGLLYYIIASIDDNIQFFRTIYNSPGDVSKLIDYTTNSSFSSELRSELLVRYTDFAIEELQNPSGIINNFEPIVIPYEAPSALVVFKDPNYLFENVGGVIKKYRYDQINEITGHAGCPGGPIIKVKQKTFVGDLDYLEPVLLPNLELKGAADDYDVEYSCFLAPAFLLPMISDGIIAENNVQGLLIAVDVASIALGGTAIFRLFSRGLLRFRSFQSVFAVGETAVGLSSLVTRLSESCQADATCKNISTMLCILEIMSIAPTLVSNMTPNLNRAVFQLESKIQDAGELRRLRQVQPDQYTQYRLKEIPIGQGEAQISQVLIDYAGVCGVGNIRMLNELSFDVIKKISAELTDVQQIGKFVDDLKASKAAAVGNQAEDILDVTGDLIEFMNLMPGGVKAWKVFNKHGDELATDIPTLTKLTDDLAANSNLETYLDDIAGFNAYKAYPSSKTDVLDAVKSVQSSGKLFNGKFDFWDNPGCIGHLDSDVDKVLLDKGWAIDPPNTSSDITTYKKLTGVVEPNGFEHFQIIQYRNLPNGALHAIDPSLPAPYWKAFEDGYSNRKLIYRSSASDNFGAALDGITTPIYKNGIDIN